MEWLVNIIFIQEICCLVISVVESSRVTRDHWTSPWRYNISLATTPPPAMPTHIITLYNDTCIPAMYLLKSENEANLICTIVILLTI